MSVRVAQQDGRADVEAAETLDYVVRDTRSRMASTSGSAVEGGMTPPTVSAGGAGTASTSKSPRAAVTQQVGTYLWRTSSAKVERLERLLDGGRADMGATR